jgi:hypothetical protein
VVEDRVLDLSVDALMARLRVNIGGALETARAVIPAMAEPVTELSERIGLRVGDCVGNPAKGLCAQPIRVAAQCADGALIVAWILKVIAIIADPHLVN